MREQSNKDRLTIAYTDKPLSGWGGLLPFFRFADKAGFSTALEAALPASRRSNNQVQPIDVVRTLMTTVLIGGSRFAHVERVRHDEVIRRITGADRLGGADSIRRYFADFTRADNEQLYEALQRVTWSCMSEGELEDVLDLDSTILDRFGQQQGVAKGYHPTRKGRRSHHPLVAIFGYRIVHCWLRAGGASTHRGALEFIDELLARIPASVRLRAVRGDSGFFSKDYLNGFEQRNLRYAVSMKMSRPVQRFCRAIESQRWEHFDEHNDVADVVYAPMQWGRPRRVVVVRSVIRPKDGAALLFDVPTYEYRAIVTDLDLSACEVIRFYNKRGDAENRIKEFKNDFGARGFCLGSFNATETVFRLISVIYNLVATFKSRVLHDASLTLATVRNRVFVIGAALGRSARRTILRLGLTGRWCTEFERLLARVASLTVSTAAQSDKAQVASGQSPSSTWRARRPSIAIV